MDVVLVLAFHPLLFYFACLVIWLYPFAYWDFSHYRTVYALSITPTCIDPHAYYYYNPVLVLYKKIRNYTGYSP